MKFTFIFLIWFLEYLILTIILRIKLRIITRKTRIFETFIATFLLINNKKYSSFIIDLFNLILNINKI